MKLFSFFIFLLLLTNSSFGQNDHKHSKKIIECLNANIINYELGISKIMEIEELDTIIANIDTMNEFTISQYDAVSCYNKMNFTIKVKYISCNNTESLIKLEKQLNELHNLELKKLETEYITRFNNLLLVYSIQNKFENSFPYLKEISNRLAISYINNCSQ